MSLEVEHVQKTESLTAAQLFASSDPSVADQIFVALVALITSIDLLIVQKNKAQKERERYREVLYHGSKSRVKHSDSGSP